MPDTGSFRARYFYLLPLLLLVGCATAAAPAPSVPTGTELLVLAETQKDSPAVAALGALADNSLLRLATEDATDTLAWIEAHKVTLGALKEFRARQCPTAVILSISDLREKVLVLQARVRALEGRVAEGPKAPELILALTKLKFGDVPNPQAAIGQLKDDIVNRLAAVGYSCAEVFPAKQIAEMFRLASRAGLIGVTGGAAAPFLGLLP